MSGKLIDGELVFEKEADTVWLNIVDGKLETSFHLRRDAHGGVEDWIVAPEPTIATGLDVPEPVLRLKFSLPEILSDLIWGHSIDICQEPSDSEGPVIPERDREIMQLLRAQLAEMINEIDTIVYLDNSVTVLQGKMLSLEETQKVNEMMRQHLPDIAKKAGL